MNKETRNNRPKRLRIAKAKTGVAQNRVQSKAFFRTFGMAAMSMDSDAWYTQIAAQAADKTPKHLRKTS